MTSYPPDVRPDAELEYLRAKARWKLERQRRRQAEDAKRSLPVDMALLVVSLLLLFIGVSIVMHNNLWRTSPGPLTPVTTTPTTTVSPRGGPGECGYPNSDECGTTQHPDECHQPWNGTPSWCPGATPTPTPNPCGSPFGGKWCDTTPPQPDWKQYCATHIDSVECDNDPNTPRPTTTSPFPTQLLCDTIRPKPPNCPPATTPTMTPGVTV